MKKFIYVLLALLFFAAWAFFSGPAFGQARRCGDRESIVDHLLRNFNEMPQQHGIGDRGELFELFTSEKGTWTLTIRLADIGGVVCVVASGNSWSSVPVGSRCSGVCG